MIGWLILALLALATAGLLWLIGFPRGLWAFAAAALMLGAAGYAWQGQPGLPGHPVKPQERRGEVDPDELAMRHAVFGQFTFADSYFVAADAMVHTGSRTAPVTVLLGGVRKSPNDLALWTGLGLAMAAHDDNTVSPAAQAAFERAAALNPKHPGPPFFRGLAHIRGGDFAGAKPWWDKALALTPPGLSYRGDIENYVRQLDASLQAQAQAGQGAPPAAPPR